MLSIDGTCSNNAVETVDAERDQRGDRAPELHRLRQHGDACDRTSGNTFTNQSAGIVDVDARCGNGGRAITGTFTNKGNVNVNVSALLLRGTWTNSGTLAIATGATLTAPSSGGVTFTNTTGGSVAATGTGLLQLDGGNTFNQGAGTTTRHRAGPAGRPTPRAPGLALHYTGTGASTIATEGSGHPRRDDFHRSGARPSRHLLQQRGRGHRQADDDHGHDRPQQHRLRQCSDPGREERKGKDPLTVGLGGVVQTDNGAGNGGRTDRRHARPAQGHPQRQRQHDLHGGDEGRFTNKKGTINIAGEHDIDRLRRDGIGVLEQEGRHRRIG